jgi:hypothetical protein
VQKAIVAHTLQHPDFEMILQKAAARTLSRSKLKEKIEGPVRFEIEWKFSENISSTNPDSEVTIVAKEEIINQVELVDQSPEILDIIPLEPEDIPDIPILNPEKETHKRKNDFGFGFVKITKVKPVEKVGEISSYTLPVNPPIKKKKAQKPEDAIIERFLEKQPGLIPPRIDFGQPELEDDLARKSGFLSEEIITENMAMIYLKQKNYEKAITTFQKLQLKFPEKSGYFAALIKNLENQR